jgi:anionic cell wall polymer biosynthesis LytR-Cps2A-Psr (LCP) family protein
LDGKILIDERDCLMSFRRKTPMSRSLHDEVTRGSKKINKTKREFQQSEIRSPAKASRDIGARDRKVTRNNRVERVYNPRTARYDKVSSNNNNVSDRDDYRAETSYKRGGQGWSIYKKVAVGLLSLFLVFLIATAGIMAYYLSRIGEVQSAPLEPEQVSITEDFDFQFDKTGYFNVAFIGVTKREGREDLGSRANTVMIASLNYDTGEVRLVSVYRDTLLELEDGSLDLVAHSYAYGGSRGTVAMLNRNLDLNIQHYVTVDFAALALTVNALGGVEIDVCSEEIVYINGLSNQMVLEGEFAPGANLSLPNELYQPGMNHLCGVQALAYSRIRMVGNNDFERTERQREVIELMAAEAAKASLGTITDIVDIVFEYLATNFTVTEILAHARYTGHYHIGETAGFPFDLAMMDLERTGSTVIPTTLATNVSMLHEFLFGTREFSPSSTVTNISANISGATFTTEDSAIDIDGDLNNALPEEIPPWIPDSDVWDDTAPGDDILHEEPTDTPEPPTEDVPSEPPPDGGEESPID